MTNAPANTPTRPDPMERLRHLRRPRLLIRAARFGLPEYRRTPTLRRLFVRAGATDIKAIVNTLFEAEAQAESNRQAGVGGYSPAHHVELLIALMAECAVLARAARPVNDLRDAAASAASERVPRRSG